ncbi:MAG: helix-turn-helix transcriptional regulator [Pirellulales bacterium]
MTDVKHHASPSREWLKRMADMEDHCESISAGGMAVDLGLVLPKREDTPRVLGRLIEFARRGKGWSVEKLSDAANVDLADSLALENEEGQPSTRTVSQVAQALGLPAKTLLELAGLIEPRQKEKLNRAAIRFAAHSEPTAQLSTEERSALDEFVKELVEASDGG